MKKYGDWSEQESTSFRTSGDNKVVTVIPSSVTGADITLTLPDESSTLVSRVSSDTGADRLQNKELSDDSVFFVDEGDTSKKLALQLSGITTATTRTWTVPDATSTFVGTDTNQILTGKTIVAANNTITTAASGNLTSTELDAALAELQGDIDTNTTSNSGVVTVHSDVTDAGSGIIISAAERTAIGTNTTNNSGSATVHSDISAGDITNLGNLSGTNTGDQTSVTGTSGNTDALNSATTTIDVSAAAAPTTNQVLTATSSTTATWQTPSESGNGEINYILNPDAENNTVSWNDYDDGSVAAPVDGTGGTAANLTLTSQATTILRGAKSFKLAKGAADAQGEGLSTDFTIDAADKNKLLKISFDYNTDGTYADSDIAVYVYDVTNATLITPADNELTGRDKDNDSSGSRTIAWASTDSTSYRLIFHVTTTSASAYDFYFDNVIVGPGSIVTGAVITAWEAYTPTNTQGFGTITPNLQWRRVGESIEVRGRFTAGTVSGSEAQIELPNSYTISQDETSTAIAGRAIRSLTSTNAFTYSVLSTDGDTFVNFGYRDGVANVQPFDPINGNTVAGTGTAVSLQFSIPVVEFKGAGTINLMSDEVAAVNAKARFYRSNGVAYTANSIVPFNAESFNEGGGFSHNGAGTVTVLFDGFVSVSARSAHIATGEGPAAIRVNGTVISQGPAFTGTANLRNGFVGADAIKVSKGDTITIITNINFQINPGAHETYIELSRVAEYSAGQPVGFGLATEESPGLVKQTVGWHVDLDGAAHTSNAFANTEIDNWVTTSSKSFLDGGVTLTSGSDITIPEGGDGTYLLNFSINWDDGSINDGIAIISFISVNDVQIATNGLTSNGPGGSQTFNMVSTIVKLSAGDVLTTTTFVNDADTSDTSVSISQNYFCGHRIGN